MEGFFGEQDLGVVQQVPQRRVRACGSCKLNKKCNSPSMPPTGKGEEKILIVGAAPGEQEDRRNAPFVGKGGQLLKACLRDEDIDLDRDCRKTYAVTCRPQKGQHPADIEIDCCRPSLFEEVKKNKPHLVILLGSPEKKAGGALKSWWSGRVKSVGAFSEWRGFVVPDLENECWVAHLYHPDFLLRKQTGPVAEVIFKEDLSLALDYLECERPYSVDDRACVKLFSSSKAKRFLEKLLQGPKRTVAFDYETTGLKPHRKGHRVVSCSIAISGKKSLAFMITPELMKPMKRFLRAKHIRKIAANFKFEEAWSRVFFGTKVVGWCWDTMVCAHVLDNRTGITSVKFQACVKMGILDYDSEIKPYLKAKKKGGNEFNRIDKISQDKLLIYNALDSLYEFRLARIQRKEIRV